MSQHLNRAHQKIAGRCLEDPQNFANHVENYIEKLIKSIDFQFEIHVISFRRDLKLVNELFYKFGIICDYETSLVTLRLYHDVFVNLNG